MLVLVHNPLWWCPVASPTPTFLACQSFRLHISVQGRIVICLHPVRLFRTVPTILFIFQLLANSKECIQLKARPISSSVLLKQQERIHFIYQHVEENFSNKIDIHQISQKVNLSVPAFCRYFKQTTKLTYTDFVNQYRINHAKKLLLQGNNVTEACFHTGFESLSYFNRAFKKQTGQTPSAFRKKEILQ
jgi:AraC-like DNA-binding protein